MPEVLNDPAKETKVPHSAEFSSRPPRIEVKSVPSASQALSVGGAGYLLVAAGGSITFDNSLGRTPTAGMTTPASATPKIQGLFFADDEIVVAGSSNAGQADNQFIGKGSFIGLTNVSLDRDFAGTADGGAVSDTNLSLRFLNNTNPTEVFIHDPQLVLNTPNFLKDPEIQFKEIQ